MATTLGTLNPLRYRSYVYDQETELYYLQSRYYDPEMGRFINADAQLNTDAILGYNMLGYCYNNPIMLSDSLGTRPILGTSIENETEEEKKDSFAFANYVARAHVKTTVEILNCGTLIGKIGFSSTVTVQDEELGLFHSYSDVGNDCTKYAAGVNLVGWLGMDLGVSSEVNGFISAQVSPWLHGELSLGLDGVGVCIGVNAGDISYDFEINIGLGAIALVFCPQLFATGGQAIGAY